MFKIEIIFSVINFIKMIKITEEIDLCVWWINYVWWFLKIIDYFIKLLIKINRIIMKELFF